MDRAALFRKTCELIANDRRGTKRDDGHHRWLVQQIDAAAAELVRFIKRLNRMLDAMTRQP